MKKLLLLCLFPFSVHAATLLTATRQFGQEDIDSISTESKGTFNAKEVCVISDTGQVTITKSYMPYSLTSTESFKVKFDKNKLINDIKAATLAKKGNFTTRNFSYDTYIGEMYSTEPMIFKVLFNSFRNWWVFNPIGYPFLPGFIWQVCKFPESQYTDIEGFFDD